MRKKSTYLLMTLVLSLLLPTAAFAQGPGCAQDYLIQSGDSLSSIASRFLGRGNAYTDIVDATNSAAQSGSYAMIDNPSLILPGWTLCIPGAAADSMTMDSSVDNTDDMTMADEMMADDMMMTSPVLVTANPADVANDMVYGLSADLSGTPSTYNSFGDISSVESVKLGQDGTLYLTADLADSTGAVIVGDTMIAGPNTGLMAPKGLYVVDDLGLILVADFGAKDIKVFSTDATGDTAPLFTVTDLGGTRSVWDIHHDLASDTLYAAGTDGAFLVYDNFSADQGMAGPNRVVTPVDGMGGKISVNLHGIYYVPSADTLLLSDVGDAASASDGQLFTIANASTVMNTAPTVVRIAGSNTALGNPVDIEFDGTNLYVAEKSNDLLLRYDNILDRTGFQNSAADLATKVTKAESVALMQ